MMNIREALIKARQATGDFSISTTVKKGMFAVVRFTESGRSTMDCEYLTPFMTVEDCLDFLRGMERV